VFRDILPFGRSASSLTPAPEQRPAEQKPTNEASAEPSPSPAHKLPPLPELSPPQPAAPSVATGESSSLASAAPPPPHVPSADELVGAMNAAKGQNQQPNVVAPNPSPVGGPQTANAEQKAAGSVPEAPPPLASSQSPAPAKPAPPPLASPTHLDQKVAANVPAPPPSAPHAPQNRLLLEQATVGEDYVADLPPFSDPADPKGLVLRAEPGLPEGLVLADLGSGFGKISGKPSRPGQYSFDIVASDPSGAMARMTTRIAIAEPQAPDQPTGTESPPVVLNAAPGTTQPPATNLALAANTPAEKAAGFIRDFDGGACFLARPLGVNGSTPIVLGVGSDKNTFERFYQGLTRTVGMEPTLTVRLIAVAQCPALGLIGATPLGDAEAPKIELTGYDVGRNKPLAGTVSNLAGRNLTLLLVGSDGQVHRIETHPRADGASATFSAPMTGDAGSLNVMQVVVAIVSQKPLPSLAEFKSGAAAEILPRVQGDLTAAGGLLGTEFFKFVN
jgi:Putative Ig domain